ncbi:MAG: hypothetical protein QM768_05545 [Agriterribacter sp.]
MRSCLIVIFMCYILGSCSGSATRTDVDSIKGNLPTAPATPPKDTLRIDSTVKDPNNN